MKIILNYGKTPKIMPIKDLAQKRAYQKNWVAHKRSQSNVEPQKNNPVVEPLKKSRTLSQCSRCEELESSISEFANLYYQAQAETEKQKKISIQLEKKLLAAQQQVVSLQETVQILNKDITYWQEK